MMFEICSNVMVGMNCVIADDVKINSYCLIGSGSFVPPGREVPRVGQAPPFGRCLVVGSPAKVIRKVKKGQLEHMAAGLAIYQGLTKRYLNSFKKISLEDGIEDRTI